MATFEQLDELARSLPEVAVLADASLPLFTNEHFFGWPAVLVRARDLGQISEEALASLVVEAWKVQAPKRLVRAWQDEATDGDDSR